MQEKTSLELLSAKVSEILQQVYNLKEENEVLRNEVVTLKAEREIKDQEIEKLTSLNAEKDQEIEEIVAKIESILD
ncbi:hypothetical protein [Sulfurimonas sp. C5]|uniref:hypothetical protein n=1 Tax=Sulfurimonas sp. C5 TaxID=3036947 RepID=UPI00245776B8|nr:hypothetical protein [Sulfurimonas sp. C5]MDH4945089.1 hypothetical protein [Sulfurimonas sp. C5]